MRYATEIKFDTRYPTVKDLVDKARKKIPGFAFEYLDGGCNEEVNKHKNTSAISAGTANPPQTTILLPTPLLLIHQQVSFMTLS